MLPMLCSWLMSATLALATLFACSPEHRLDPPPPAESPAPVVENHNHLPEYLRGARITGPVAAAKALDLRIHLAPRAERDLDLRLEAITDPEGASFGEVLTPDQFRERYAPSSAQISDTVQWLQRFGITVAGHHGGVLRATATAEQAQNAFAVELVHLENGSQDGYAPRAAIKPPPRLGIVAVHGLASKPPRAPRLRRFADGASRAFTGSGIRRVYNVPSGAQGAGATVGLLELDGFNPAEVRSYTDANHLPAPKVTAINVDGFDGRVIDPGAQVETQLDIELVLAMAPQADVRVYQAGNTLHAWFDLLTEMANPSLADKKLVRTISISWGRPESGMSPALAYSEFLLLRQMAAQGQTVYVASGDAGARADGYHVGVDDPGNQPWAIAVGGTRLRADSEGHWAAEAAWDLSGGGASRLFGVPAWQAALADAANHAPRTVRLVPDVAAAADPETGHWVYVGGRWMVVGGTSAAAPLWAGLTALAEERRKAAGKPPLPFLAPSLYRLARQGALRDVSGANNGLYDAVPGYDLATGLGSFDGERLLAGLAGL